MLDAYARLTPGEWLPMKWAGLRTLVGDSGPLDLWRGPSGPFGESRQTDFSFVLPSLRLANLGWVALLVTAVSARFRRPVGRRTASAATWVLLAIVGLLMNVLVSWYIQIIPVQSYLSLLLLATGLCTAIVAGPSWLKWPAITAHVVYFCLVWVWAPFRLVPARPDYCLGWGLTAVAIFLVALDGTASRDPGVPGQILARPSKV